MLDITCCSPVTTYADSMAHMHSEQNNRRTRPSRESRIVYFETKPTAHEQTTRGGGGKCGVRRTHIAFPLKLNSPRWEMNPHLS